MKKHIQEHIEFNKNHGIYNDEHSKEEEEVYNTGELRAELAFAGAGPGSGILIPYLISKKSKQKNKDGLDPVLIYYHH